MFVLNGPISTKVALLNMMNGGGHFVNLKVMQSKYVGIHYNYRYKVKTLLRCWQCSLKVDKKCLCAT